MSKIDFNLLNKNINEYNLIKLILNYTGKPIQCIVCNNFNKENMKICINCFNESIEISSSHTPYIRKWISYIPNSRCKSCLKYFDKTVGLKGSYHFYNNLEHKKFCSECFNLSLSEYYSYK